MQMYSNIHCVSYYGPGFFTYFFNLYNHYEPFIYPSYYFFKYGRDRKRENTFLSTQSIGYHIGCMHPIIDIECNKIISYIEHLGYYCNYNNIKNILIIGDKIDHIILFICNYSEINNMNIVIVSSEFELNLQKIMLKKFNKHNIQYIKSNESNEYNEYNKFTTNDTDMVIKLLRIGTEIEQIIASKFFITQINAENAENTDQNNKYIYSYLNHDKYIHNLF